MDAPLLQTPHPTPSAMPAKQTTNDLRADIIEILSNTANGCLAELGYYPGLVPRLREAETRVTQLQAKNAALWEDNRRLAQCLEVAKNRLTVLRAPEDDRIARILSLVEEAKGLKNERDALRSMLSHGRGERTQRLMEEIDILNHRHQVASTDIAILHNNLIRMTSMMNPSGALPTAPPTQAPTQDVAHQQENYMVSQPNAIPVAVPVPQKRRVSQDMHRPNQSQPHPHGQMRPPQGGQSMIPVPAQQQAGYGITQAGHNVHQQHSHIPAYPAPPPGPVVRQGHTGPGYAVSPPPPPIQHHPPINVQPVHYQAVQYQSAYHHTAQPIHHLPTGQQDVGIVNTGVVPRHPHGQSIPHPAVHSAPGPRPPSNQPILHHAPPSQQATPQVVSSHSPFTHSRSPSDVASSSHRPTPNNSRPASSHSTRAIHPLSINTHISPVHTSDMNNAQPRITHKPVSQHAYPMTPSTPSMNLRESDIQYPYTPTSARMIESPQGGVVSVLSSNRTFLRRKEPEIVDLTNDDEPEPKRPRLEERPSLSVGPSTIQVKAELPSEDVIMTMHPESDEPTSEQNLEEAEDDALSPDGYIASVASVFQEVEKGKPEKGHICLFCQNRYQNDSDPDAPPVLINLTLDEQVEHVKTLHPRVWDVFCPKEASTIPDSDEPGDTL